MAYVTEAYFVYWWGMTFFFSCSARCHMYTTNIWRSQKVSHLPLIYPWVQLPSSPVTAPMIVSKYMCNGFQLLHCCFVEGNIELI